jgi:acetyl esterase/lipase
MRSGTLAFTMVLACAPWTHAVAKPPEAAAPMMVAEAAATIRLWEGDAPGALGKADQDIPTITWWPAKQAAGATSALVVCPGGGYGGLADHEGTDYARWLNTQGISAFVLRYRLGSKGYRHPVMLGDVRRAIRMVRHDAEKFSVDAHRVGVIGSSAGGHLALTACLKGDDGNATSDDPVERQSSRPVVGVLCYPVVSMLPEKTHAGSRKNLLGENPAEELARELSGELAVHEHVPPLFIWHTYEDQAVKLEPILELGLALKKLGKPFELHVYETGRHGLGLGVRPYDGVKQLHPWTVECQRWLGSQGL